jgi:hypothetical protein
MECVRNHIKLGIGSFVMNFNRGGLADLWGIAEVHCQKVESTKWLQHKLSQ